MLIAWPEKLAVVSGLRAPTSSTVEDPGVLSLCTNAPWFSLLPVTGPPGTRVISSTPQIHTDKPQVNALSQWPLTVSSLCCPCGVVKHFYLEGTLL